MNNPLGHVRSLLASAIRRRGAEQADGDALRELSWSAAGGTGDLPAGLAVQWLGTAGYAISYEGHTVLIDPYVTRFSLGDTLRRRVVLPDATAIDRHLPRADAVLIGHTHFDHVLDAPAVARRDGCKVYGSSSVATLLGVHGLSSQAVVVEPYHAYEIGPFAVTFVPSVHSKLIFGMYVPSAGPITCEHLDRLLPRAYKCDQVWGSISPSAV